jgi:hypothetical protein
LAAAVVFGSKDNVGADGYITIYERGRSVRDPDAGYFMSPYSRSRAYYPSNPRGYFHVEPPEVFDLRRRWRLAGDKAPDADFEFIGSPKPLLRITTPTAALAGWELQLVESHFSIQAGVEYSLTFSARANPPREVQLQLGQAHPPWKILASKTVSISGEWQEYRWNPIASAKEDDSQVAFALGGKPSTVEFTGLRFQGPSADVKPAADADAPPAPYFVEYRMDRLGYRGPDRAIPRPRDVFRIVCLGDSLTMGVGVHQSDDFCSRLEQRLNADPAAAGPGRFEVINCGLRGLSTREERVHFERRAKEYDPQLVLVVAYINDHESIFETYDKIHRTTRRAMLERLAFAANEATYQVVSGELAELSDHCKRQGRRFAVVLFRYEPRNAVWQAMSSVVARFAASHQVPFCDIGDEILRRAAGRDLCVHAVDMHPNETAHELAAEAIEGFLRRNRLLTSPTADEPNRHNDGSRRPPAPSK